MKYIAISGKAFHGKSTVAGMMQEYLMSKGKSVLVVNYGDLVKFFAKNYFNWDGSKDEAGRNLLQFIGTEAVRVEDPGYWVRFVANAISMFSKHGANWDFVLVGDVRFPNEIEIPKEYNLDVKHLRVVRPGFRGNMTDAQLSHISETALDYYESDFMICNDEGLEELKKKVKDISDLLIGE